MTNNVVLVKKEQPPLLGSCSFCFILWTKDNYPTAETVVVVVVVVANLAINLAMYKKILRTDLLVKVFDLLITAPKK